MRENKEFNLTEVVEPAGFFALRTPLLPFDDFLRWSQDLRAPNVEREEELPGAVIADAERLRARLKGAFHRLEMKEALFIASPELYARFEEWLKNPESAGAKGMDLTLARYFARMCGRATPFGLFAGCTVGSTGGGKRTEMTLEGLHCYKRHTRLDMDYLSMLTLALTRDQRLQTVLRFRPNSSLYKVSKRWHYVEARWNGRLRSHHLVAVDSTDYLDATLARATGGAQMKELATALAEADEAVSLPDAEEYIAELITNQVLIPEIDLSVTGEEPIHRLIRQLDEHPETEVEADRLREVQRELEALDMAGSRHAPSRYLNFANSLSDLGVKVEIQRLFQVDMLKPAREATLGTEVIAEIMRGAQILNRLTPPQDQVLHRFKQRFLERYKGREVSLVEALDYEIGIGFGAIRDEAQLREPEDTPQGQWSQEVFSRDGNALLMRKVFTAQTNGQIEVELEENELKILEARNPPPLPGAFAVVATLAASSAEATRRGDYRVEIDSVMGPSGALLLGRFCHADPQLAREVENHLRAEEALHPDAVFAEIVHLPEGRIGNVICRPLLRQYEIPYLGCSGAAADFQLPITDLMVSVVDDRIVLRSPWLSKEIIPRLTNAHNFHHGSVPVYHFLCALQGQGAASALKWNWGALSDFPFLPRIVSGRVVLSRARWILDRQEIKSLSEPRGAERYKIMQDFRRERKLPRFIALADGDNELPVDLENVLSVEMLIELIKRRDRAVLIELFFKDGPEELFVTSSEGKFVHELVVPFIRKQPATLRPSTPVQSAVQFDERTFPPGSEWLYAKIYGGEAMLNGILRDLARPVISRAIETGAADSWFFIRYRDPHPHLRLRLHGTPDKLRADVIPSLHDAVSQLMKEERCWRMQICTYEREIERYGGLQGTVLAEQLFCADSEFVLKVVENLDGDRWSDDLWLLALRAVDQMLNDFQLDLEPRHEMLRRLLSQPEKGRDTGSSSHHLRKRYRLERQRIEMALAPDYGDAALPDSLRALRDRSEKFRPVIDQLRAFERDGELHREVNELVPSYLHMNINRIFRSAQNAQEIVIYSFLERYYESRLLRGKRRGQPQILVESLA